MVSVGKFIKQKRTEKDMTQMDLCSKTDITQSWLSQIEGDVKTPDPSTIRHILAKLRVHNFVLIYVKDSELTYIKKLKVD